MCRGSPDGVLPIIESIFTIVFLFLALVEIRPAIGLDHGCNRSRALALRDRIVGSAKAGWPIFEMSQSRHGRTSSCAAPASADSPQPWRSPNGLDLESQTHQSRSMDAKFGPESAAAALSRSHSIGAMSEAYRPDSLATFH